MDLTNMSNPITLFIISHIIDEKQSHRVASKVVSEDIVQSIAPVSMAEVLVTVGVMIVVILSLRGIFRFR